MIAAEQAHAQKISSDLTLHRPHWEKCFGVNGKNSAGETLEDYIASMYPIRHFKSVIAI